MNDGEGGGLCPLKGNEALYVCNGDKRVRVGVEGDRNVCVCVCVCLFVHMYVCMYVCMHACVSLTALYM